MVNEKDTETKVEEKQEDVKPIEKVADTESDVDEKIRVRKEQSLKEREDSITEREQKVETQRAEVSRMIDELARSGKGMVSKELTQDDRAIQHANQYLEGTGLKIPTNQEK